MDFKIRRLIECLSKAFLNILRSTFSNAVKQTTSETKQQPKQETENKNCTITMWDHFNDFIFINPIFGSKWNGVNIEFSFLLHFFGLVDRYAQCSIEFNVCVALFSSSFQSYLWNSLYNIWYTRALRTVATKANIAIFLSQNVKESSGHWRSINAKRGEPNPNKNS